MRHEAMAGAGSPLRSVLEAILRAEEVTVTVSSRGGNSGIGGPGRHALLPHFLLIPW